MRMGNPQKPLVKARKLEEKGDTFRERGKYDKAADQYRKALKLNPQATSILKKLEETLFASPREWGLKEFAESLDLTMRHQEKEHPVVRQSHARFDPEWKNAVALALQLFESHERKKQAELTELLVAKGEMGTRALIDVLVGLGKASEKKDKS